MSKVMRVFLVAAALSVFAAACSDDSETTDDAATDDAATDDAATDDAATDDAATGDDEGGDAAAPAGDADLQVVSTDLGDILVDRSGNTVYLYTPDEGAGVSTCDATCLGSWPVVAEVGTVGEGIDEGLLSTFAHEDGTVQATYNGWPLYYYAADAVPGDTAGQDVGGVWYVVDAGGNAIGA